LIGITIFQFTHTNETGSIFVKYLESSNEIFWFAWSAKAVRSIEDAEEQVEVNYPLVTDLIKGHKAQQPRENE
jgi:hypothetical protein